MKDSSFKVALASLNNFVADVIDRKTLTINKAKLVLENALKEIENKKIKKTKDLFIFLSNSKVTKNHLKDVLRYELDNLKDQDKLLDIALYLGKGNKGSGIGLLPDSWLKRNVDDTDLKKYLAPRWWFLFRDKSWIEKNKVTKD